MKSIRTPMKFFCVALLTAGATAAGPRAFAQEAKAEGAGDAIEKTRLELDRWLEIRRTISREQADWVLSRETLQARIELLKRDIAEVTKKVEVEKAKLDKFDGNIQQLEAQNETFKQAAEEMAKLVEQLEARALKLLESAPEHLREEVKPLSVQLPGYNAKKKAEPNADAPPTTAPESADGTAQAPKDNAEPEVSLARRVQNVVGVLYLLNKATGKIETTNEQITRPDGSPLFVSAVYFGTSYGYYVDDEDKNAAGGRPGPGGWTWTPLDSAAQNVRSVLKIISKDQTAAFITLPVEVD